MTHGPWCDCEECEAMKADIQHDHLELDADYSALPMMPVDEEEVPL